MTWESWATVTVAFAALVVQTVGIIVAGIWRIARLEASIRDEISNHRLESERRVDQAIRSVGETFTALRQKITEVELYVRDTFVQKESFRVVINQIMTDMKGIGDRIEARLLRMENKLDRDHDQRDRNSD